MLHGKNRRIEQYRITKGPLASDESYENNGAFHAFAPADGQTIYMIASDGEGWEHVSVSLETRCPTWDEMCWVKDLFWNKSETVIQYFPAKNEYINNHQYCLHLWKPIGVKLPKPPTNLIGIKGGELC